DAGQAVAWATRALELSDELGETQIGVHARNSMATARLLSDDAAAEGELERSLALAVDAGLEDDVARAMAHLGWTAQRRRSYQLALDVLDRGLRLASDRGWELRRAYLLA